MLKKVCSPILNCHQRFFRPSLHSISSIKQFSTDQTTDENNTKIPSIQKEEELDTINICEGRIKSIPFRKSMEDSNKVTSMNNSEDTMSYYEAQQCTQVLKDSTPTTHGFIKNNKKPTSSTSFRHGNAGNNGGNHHHRSLPGREIDLSIYDDVDLAIKPDLLRLFISPTGKILPSRFTGLRAKDQRKLSRCIKISRQIGLLPYQSRYPEPSPEQQQMMDEEIIRRHELQDPSFKTQPYEEEHPHDPSTSSSS